MEEPLVNADEATVSSVANELGELLFLQSPYDKRLISLVNYPVTDKLRWSSQEGLKEDITCGASICVTVRAAEQPLAGGDLEEIFYYFARRGRDDRLLPFHSLTVSNTEVPFIALKRLMMGLLRQGSYCQLRSLCITNAGLKADTFKALLICPPLTDKLTKLDLSHNPDLALPDGGGRLKLLLDKCKALEILYLDHTGLPKEGIDALCRLLPNSAAAKALKALRFGPPSDGQSWLFLEKIETTCPQKRLSSMNAGRPTLRLPYDGADADCAGQAAAEPAPGQAGSGTCNSGQTRAGRSRSHPRRSHNPSAVPGRRQALNLSTRENGTGQHVRSEGAAPSQDWYGSGATAAPARRQARQAAAGTSFEDHLHGFVDLEGENPEDDARATVVGAEQREFLAEVDQSRRMHQRQQRPKSGPRRRVPSFVPDMVFDEETELGHAEELLTSEDEASPERELYGGALDDSEPQAADQVPAAEEDAQDATEDLGIVSDDEDELEFGVDAEKEKARRRRRPLTEADELRAFGFEDEETAREHRPRGHFGLPENEVRASRWRPNAAERLRQERQAREARLRRGQAEQPASPQAQAGTSSADENVAPDRGGEAGSARMAVRQMVDIARGASGGAASDDEEAELQLQAAAHRWRHPNLVDSEEQEGAAAEQPPSNMGRSSRTLNASPPVPHKLDKTHEGPIVIADSDPEAAADQLGAPQQSPTSTEQLQTISPGRPRNSSGSLSGKESADLGGSPSRSEAGALPAAADTVAPNQEGQPVHSASPLPREGLVGSGPHGSGSDPAAEQNSGAASADQQPMSGDPKPFHREQSLALRAALEGAQGETPAAPPRRLTEAQRLVMLWPGDKFIHEHPANAKALGVEVLADGAKRQRRKPMRLLEEAAPASSRDSNDRPAFTSRGPEVHGSESSDDDDLPLALVLGRRPKGNGSYSHGQQATPADGRGMGRPALQGLQIQRNQQAAASAQQDPESDDDSRPIRLVYGRALPAQQQRPTAADAGLAGTAQSEPPSSCDGQAAAQALHHAAAELVSSRSSPVVQPSASPETVTRGSGGRWPVRASDICEQGHAQKEAQEARSAGVAADSCRLQDPGRPPSSLPTPGEADCGGAERMQISGHGLRPPEQTSPGAADESERLLAGQTIDAVTATGAADIGQLTGLPGSEGQVERRESIHGRPVAEGPTSDTLSCVIPDSEEEEEY